MFVSIRRCLGVFELNLELTGFDVIYGPRGAGKTSVLNSIRGALSNGNPLGLNQASSQAYRHNGEGGSYVDIHYSGGKTHWFIPGFEGLGNIHYSSRAALGMVDLISATSPVLRLAAWQEVVDLKEESGVVKAMQNLNHLTQDEAAFIARSGARRGWDPSRSRLKGGNVTKQLGGIVSRLRDINQLAEWGDTELNPETLEITFNTRPVQCCSTSERWRADAALRLAIALEDNSTLWLADDANHLEVSNLKRLNSLIGRLRQSQGTGVIFKPEAYNYLIAFTGPESAVSRLFTNAIGWGPITKGACGRIRKRTRLKSKK